MRRSPSTALMWPWRWPCAATCKSMWSGSKCSSSGCGVVYLGIPLTVWVMFASFLAAFIMLNHTRLGAHIYATGANYNAARLNGVPVENIIRITLVLSSVFIAIGGMVATARSGITILFGSTNALNTSDAFLAVLLRAGSRFSAAAARLNKSCWPSCFWPSSSNGYKPYGSSHRRLVCHSRCCVISSLSFWALRAPGPPKPKPDPTSRNRRMQTKTLEIRQPIFERRNLSKSFGAVQAVRKVSWEVFPGEVTALVGDNGAGRSTADQIDQRCFDQR